MKLVSPLFVFLFLFFVLLPSIYWDLIDVKNFKFYALAVFTVLANIPILLMFKAGRDKMKDHSVNTLKGILKVMYIILVVLIVSPLQIIERPFGSFILFNIAILSLVFHLLFQVLWDLKVISKLIGEKSKPC